MEWTVLKNAYGYRNSSVPELKSMFNFSANTRTSRSMPLLDVKRHSSMTFKRSVHYRTVHAWNKLPKDIEFTSEFVDKYRPAKFKQLVSEYLVDRRVTQINS